MPLFAYGIATGFFYAKQRGSLDRYLKRMLLFSVVSQVPFLLVGGSGLNIGFTWLCALVVLVLFFSQDRKTYRFLGLLVLLFLGVVTHFEILVVDYGFYGIMLPALFYILIVTGKENVATYTLILACGWIYHVVFEHGSLLQSISIFSAFILAVYKKQEINLKLPKWIGYAFYPAHLLILAVLKYIVS